VSPAPAAAAVRVCGGAGAALLRVALPRRAPGPRNAALDAAACRSSAAAEPCARMACARGRPAGRPGWAGAARLGLTVGAQASAQHRARGAAGGGRLAEPEVPVSARRRRANMAPPMRRRGVGRVVAERARTRRARLGTCVRA
jgi:hypothetical protein